MYLLYQSSVQIQYFGKWYSSLPGGKQIHMNLYSVDDRPNCSSTDDIPITIRSPVSDGLFKPRKVHSGFGWIRLPTFNNALMFSSICRDEPIAWTPSKETFLKAITREEKDS
jgi:hypothetical protein